jgi:hypothetical protein
MVVVVALACVLAASGCGDTASSDSATAPTSSQTSTRSKTATAPTLIDALVPPKATVMKPGDKVTVTERVRKDVGWQVSCVAKGTRVNAESIKGQRTDLMRSKNSKNGARELIGRNGGTPSIWLTHGPEGSLIIECR